MARTRSEVTAQDVLENAAGATQPSRQVGQNATGTRKAGEIVVEPASLTTPETGAVAFELGTIYVPENRAEAASRIIGVGFARFRALRASSAPPTFHLPGGPGDSYLRGLKQDNKQLKRWMSDSQIAARRVFC